MWRRGCVGGDGNGSTAWGGPIDYLDSSCGIVVTPNSRESRIAGFSDAMTRLATSSDLRARLGGAGYTRAREHFDWERKIDQILVLAGHKIQIGYCPGPPDLEITPRNRHGKCRQPSPMASKSAAETWPQEQDCCRPTDWLVEI